MILIRMICYYFSGQRIKGTHRQRNVVNTFSPSDQILSGKRVQVGKILSHNPCIPMYSRFCFVRFRHVFFIYLFIRISHLIIFFLNIFISIGRSNITTSSKWNTRTYTMALRRWPKKIFSITIFCTFCRNATRTAAEY